MSERNDDDWEAFLRWKSEQQHDPEPAPDTSGLSVGELTSGSRRVEFDPPHSDRPVQLSPAADTSLRGGTRTRWLIPVTVLSLLLLAAGGGVWVVQSQREQARAIEAVEASIMAIGVVTVQDAQEIAFAKEAYDALDSDLAARVTNASVLGDALDQLTVRLEEVSAAQGAIDRAVTNPTCSNALFALPKYELLDRAQRDMLRDADSVLVTAANCEEESAAAAMWEPRLRPPQTSLDALAARMDEAERKRNLLRLEGEWWEGPEETSAGQCEHWIYPDFTNLAEDSMEYVEFSLSLLDEDGAVQPDVNDAQENTVRVVGPIGPGARYRQAGSGFALTYDCLTFTGLQLNSVVIQWAGGSLDTISDGNVRCAKSWGGECEG